ncbi:sensor domain-containing diguanylate cyclase [Roseomonas sp. KE2513]|uniref:GGDEF domain-containing protein n=1 Tax=Roseomonas sp. KE2513 TaxID=2479202 RepID=UPI0018E00EE2|nr:sensor domain-containing diguanylate cyclase [Roseomonas sp. KE2513]
MGVAVGVLGLGALVLLDARTDAWRQAEQASANLTRALEADIARNIHTYDLSLQGTSAALSQPGLDQATPEVRHMALFDRAGVAEYLGSVLVLNAEGTIVANSTSLVPERLNFADRDYFRVHQDRAEAGLYISRPYQSRLRRGDPSIAISRRLPGAERFQGVVMGAMRLAYFQDLFSKLDLGSQGSVTLLRTDGTVVARHPFREGDVGRDLSGSDTFRRISASPFGRFVANAPLDGVERLYTFRHVGDLPLILSVGVSTAEVYAAWWNKVSSLGSILLVLGGATVALCLLFKREMLRRLEAEKALTEAAERLSVIAATDGLTGLANRRQFDAVLDREWRRAARNALPVSLLLLDADFFKAYNDRYGHQKGDEVLRGIAACIRSVLRRPGDTGARYGGEEFVVILPDTDAAGAWTMAERLRDAVAALEIPHAASPIGLVSVSIGIATAYPQRGQLPDPFVEEADCALYDAKRGGRNRVCAAVPIASVLSPPTKLAQKQ